MWPCRVGVTPCHADAAGVPLARRPRLYWMTWEFQEEPGLVIEAPRHEGFSQVQPVLLTANIEARDFLEPGWFVPDGQRLATFTTSRPSG